MIKTERLRLRPAEPGDLAGLHAVFSHPAAMRYWSHETHETIAQTQATLDGMMESFDQTGLELVIQRDGTVIGKAGLWRMAEIGYILHPDHWGQGLAREALLEIIAAAWRTHPELAQITAEIDPRNQSSIRLLTHLGFALTHSDSRTLHVYGEWCDSDFYALPRPAHSR